MQSKYSYKENSCFKPPYGRPSTGRLDPNMSKILNKPRSSENNYGRSLVPMKPLSLKNSFPNSKPLSDYNEPSTSYVEQNLYEYDTKSWSEYEPGHFRPRKSQLEARRSNFDYSNDIKMMHIGDSSEISKKPKLAETQGSPAKSFQIKPRQNLLRLFTGCVENLMQWSKLKTHVHILFEVTAIIENIQQGKWKSEKCFLLSDSKSGPKLPAVYYEIDRPLPKFEPNSIVTCFGRLITRNRFQAYKVEQSSEETKNDLQRLSFICNRSADEIITATQKKMN